VWANGVNGIHDAQLFIKQLDGLLIDFNEGSDIGDYFSHMSILAPIKLAKHNLPNGLR